ncbi:MAG: bifunctional oligoribonuclease/PAP phosphatase NrnA [Bacilli bacterium]|nr:bifunctional oligoribonuclease/PAP phosphatase NrnA [Bacilli bacterium]
MSYFEKEVNEVFSRIEAADSIVIFGHKNPDGDCVGSVLGLKYGLQGIFPEKKIYGVGSRPSFIGFMDKSDEVDDETIKNSLCVMVDLSDVERVEDQRIKLTDNIVGIDHHEASEPFSHPLVRDSKAPAATFIIAKILLERYGRIPAKAATPLFLGLITDSGRFQFDSSKETFRIAGELVEAGADFRWCYNNLYIQSSKDLRFRSYVYSNFKFDDKVAYFCVPRKAYLELNMTEQEAGCKVNLISLLDNHPLWCCFTELESGKIRVELRSNGKYNVQKVAVKFGGGGHIPASGCQLDSFDQVQDVINAMNQAESVN